MDANQFGFEVKGYFMIKVFSFIEEEDLKNIDIHKLVCVGKIPIKGM